MADIQKSIEMATRPVHLMPRLGPSDSACISQRAISGAPLLNRGLD